MKNFLEATMAKYKKWTEDDIHWLREGCLLGLTAKEIALALDRTEDTIKSKKVALGLTGLTTHNRGNFTTKKEGKIYTDEELLEILKTSPVKTYSYFTSGKTNTPSAATYVNRFGSWTKALELAGLPYNSSSMLPDKLTLVYLVYFPGEDIYKIGITQQEVRQRFYGYPDYEILLVHECSLLQEARALEKCWLSNVSHLKYEATTFPLEGRGVTETFKFP